ncbi:MAG: zinc-ribbon domain-containing protein [Chloroflexi bacterium]|nr:zinc-ribbon domain-containing protein [Chloroflexota bacterium]
MIIWGSKGRAIEVERGKFYCPKCQSHRSYSYKEIGKYFTLYFIPLFKTATIGTYVECQTCFAIFDKEVLNYDPTPPKEIQEIIQAINETTEAGAPLQTIYEFLKQQDVDKNTAEKLIALALKGKLKVCKPCMLTFSTNLNFCSKCGSKLTEVE